MLSFDYLVYLILIAIGFVVGLKFSRRNSQLQPIVILLGITLASEIVSRVLAYTIRNNSPGYHFFTPLQILLWSWFFWANIKARTVHRVLPFLSAALLLFAVINSFFWQGLKTFPSNVLKIETVFLLFLGVRLFLEFIDAPGRVWPHRNALFVVAVAVLWFNLISFIFFQLHDTLIRQQISLSLMRTVHYTSNMVY